VSELHRTDGRGSETAWLTWPGCSARLVGVLLVGLAAVGCESQRAPSPIGPTFTFQPPPVSTVSVRVDGRVLDVDTRQPIPAATVALGGLLVTADVAGSFSFTTELPQDWTFLRLNVSRNGYEPAQRSIAPHDVAAVELGAYPTLHLRPGESVTAQIAHANGLTNNVCWFLIDDYSCRRIVVDAPAGEPVDVELAVLSGSQDIGLIDSEQQPAFAEYQRRITVSAGQVWIVGDPAVVRLTASRQ